MRLPDRDEWLDWPLAWSFDPEEYDFSELESHLWRNASMMFAQADTAHAGDRAGKHLAALTIGVAVESLAKAFLVKVNPGLIADRGDIDSILIFTGAVEYLAPNARARTRMGKEVLKTAREMITVEQSSQPWTVADEDAVLEARNAVAHLGLLRDRDKAEFFEAGKRILAALLPHTTDFMIPFWPNDATR